MRSFLYAQNNSKYRVRIEIKFSGYVYTTTNLEMITFWAPTSWRRVPQKGHFFDRRSAKSDTFSVKKTTGLGEGLRG